MNAKFLENLLYKLKCIFIPWLEIDRLRKDCAEAYQVVGSMSLSEENEVQFKFDDDQVLAALDNLSAACNGMPRPHDDLLPFTGINVNCRLAKDFLSSDLIPDSLEIQNNLINHFKTCKICLNLMFENNKLTLVRNLITANASKSALFVDS